MHIELLNGISDRYGMKRTEARSRTLFTTSSEILVCSSSRINRCVAKCDLSHASFGWRYGPSIKKHHDMQCRTASVWKKIFLVVCSYRTVCKIAHDIRFNSVYDLSFFYIATLWYVVSLFSLVLLFVTSRMLASSFLALVYLWSSRWSLCVRLCWESIGERLLGCSILDYLRYW